MPLIIEYFELKDRFTVVTYLVTTFCIFLLFDGTLLYFDEITHDFSFLCACSAPIASTPSIAALPLLQLTSYLYLSVIVNKYEYKYAFQEHQRA